MKKIFKFFKEFGFGFTIKLSLFKVMFKLTKKQKFREKVFQLKLNYLKSKYSNVLVDNTDAQPIEKDFTVYILWWQGLDSENPPPEIVRACINSAKALYQDRVVLLDQNNYSNYADIPDYIIEKFNQGFITLTHFSDIIRACVLSSGKGGAWFDATLLCTQKLENLNEFEFYSNKLPDKENYLYNVGKADWSAFFLVCGADNPIAINLKNILFEYWKTHKTLIDYFLIDYCIKMSYDNTTSAKTMIDKVPFNNTQIHNLQPVLFETLGVEKFEEMKKSTSIFKLTYKFDKQKAELPNTIYKHLLDENLEKNI